MRGEDDFMLRLWLRSFRVADSLIALPFSFFFLSCLLGAALFSSQWCG